MTIFQNNRFYCINQIEIGQKMEDLAYHYLRKKGLRLLLRNYRCKMGEIDLIMKDNDFLVFIEVRYRSQASHGSSLESVHYTKQVKLIRTAEYYLLTHHLDVNCNARFDIIGIDGKAMLHSVRPSLRVPAGYEAIQSGEQLRKADLMREYDLEIHWLKNVIELK